MIKGGAVKKLLKRKILSQYRKVFLSDENVQSSEYVIKIQPNVTWLSHSIFCVQCLVQYAN